MKLKSGITGISPEKRALFAKMLEDEGVEPFQPIPKRDRTVRPPLSFPQQRLWWLAQLNPENPVYNIPQTLRLKGTLDVRALEESFTEVSALHKSLRTTFVVEEGRPVQVISPAEPMTLPVRDLSERPVVEREKAAIGIVEKEARRPFDLANGPLIRAMLLRLEREDHIL